MTAEIHGISDPGSKAIATALACGGAITFLAWMSLFFMPWPQSEFIYFMPLGAGFVVFLLVAASQTATLQTTINEKESKRLASDQNLLSQKAEMEQRIDDIASEIHRNTELTRQLQAVKVKMMDTGDPLYASRIPVLDKAMAQLTQEAHNHRRLIDEYSKAIKIIEIEYGTSAAAAQIPDADIKKLIGQMNELKAIEEKNKQLRIQLEANEEVRKLLV